MFYKIIHCFQLWTKNMHSTYTWELYAPEQLSKDNNPVFDLIISVSTYIGKCSFISKFSLSNLSRTAITELTKKKELKARILSHNFITGYSPLQDGASPTALIRVFGGVDLTLQSVDKVGQSLPFVLTETLRHRHHAYHVTLKCKRHHCLW